MTWELPSQRACELLRRGAEIGLHPPQHWLDELDAATLLAPDGQQRVTDPVLVAATRRTNRSNLQHWVTANLRSPGARVTPNTSEMPLRVARDLVRRGLDGAMLDSYRRGHTVALRYWMEVVFSLTSDPIELRELLEVSYRSIGTFIEDTVEAIAAQMARERAHLTSGTHAERRESVALLLEGAPLTRSRAQELLGYSLDGEHTAAVVWSEASHADLTDLDRAADLVATAAGDPRPLTVLAAAATRWLWVHGAVDAPGLRAAVARFPAVRIALGPAGHDLDGFRRSHYDALTVQRMLASLAAPQQLASYPEVELVALLAADRTRADRFVANTLGTLDTAAPDLREALRAYLNAGCNATIAAARLYTHRNTLQRRLLRAEELLPAPLENTRVAVAAALEIHHWRGER